MQFKIDSHIVIDDFPSFTILHENGYWSGFIGIPLNNKYNGCSEDDIADLKEFKVFGKETGYSLTEDHDLWWIGFNGEELNDVPNYNSVIKELKLKWRDRHVLKRKAHKIEATSWKVVLSRLLDAVAYLQSEPDKYKEEGK